MLLCITYVNAASFGGLYCLHVCFNEGRPHGRPSRHKLVKGVEQHEVDM